MSRILVTGANGFVGTALVRYLANLGHDVVAVVRKKDQKPPGATSVSVIPDIVTADWTAPLQGVDAVVHLAALVHQTKNAKLDPTAEFRAVNRDATIALAKAAANAGVKRFVFLSSVKAAVDHTLPDGVDETIYAKPESPYGLSKLEAEYALLEIGKETSLEIVILRPPLIYGPGVKANFQSLIKLVKLRVPLPLGSINNLRSMLGLSNLLAALRLSLTSPAVAGKVFFLADSEPISTPDLMRAIAMAAGRKVWLVRVSLRAIREVTEMVGLRDKVEKLAGSLVVSSAAFRAATGWETEPMQAELERLMASLYPIKDTKKTGKT